MRVPILGILTHRELVILLCLHSKQLVELFDLCVSVV